MKTSRFVSVQDPAGLWTPMQLIGASVKIKSTSIASGLFSYDADSVYTIESIGLRMNHQGKAYSVVKLNEISGEFSWKDLEVTGLSFYFYPKAICGEFCSGMTKCGYSVPGGREEDNYIKYVKNDGDNLTLRNDPYTYIQEEDDGEILD